MMVGKLAKMKPMWDGWPSDPVMYEGERWRFLPLLSKQEKNDLLYTLDVMAEALDTYGLSYFLVDGTLLGLVRSRGILPWDDDIDVALNGSLWAQIKNVLCCVKGFTLVPKDFMHWKFFMSNGTIIRNSPEHNFPFVDLFLYTEDEEFIWSLTRYNLRNLLFRKTEVFPLARAMFDGKLYPVPRLAEHIVRTQFLDLNVCVSPSMFHKYNLALNDKNIARVRCDVLKPMYKLFNSIID
ncbi:hypothetical protein Btru_019170 [Bulinus truncatus]|nr:hypothetical protein Btru_019170 [Bulinus truncatus]